MTLRRYVGDRAFYRKLFAVMIPILIQNVITNFVSLLDNVMVGQVGTESMSGVAIVNQLLFVFNICIFGGLSGAGILTAQYHGKNDVDGVRHTVRMKLWIGLLTVLAFGSVLLLRGSELIQLFLHPGEEDLDLAATLRYGRSYLDVMLLQMAPFALTQIYSGTLRETGETVLPMKAGIAAVFVNLSFNYILIFGKLGAPALGVVGAAAATVLSRFVECAIVMIWTHRHRDHCPWIKGALRSLSVPWAVAWKIVRIGAPLLINELLWSGGMTTLEQCFSLRGLEVVSALNINNTVSNLFFCAALAVGSATAIIVGQLMGAGELERAVDEDRKLIAFSVVLCTGVGLVMAILAPLVPRLYNTTPLVKHLAARLLLINAAMMPVNAYTNSCYFTLRSGGKTLITFVFDSLYVWVLSIPTAFVLSHFTSLPILPMYILVYLLDLAKCVVGYILIKRRSWVVNLVEQ